MLRANSSAILTDAFPADRRGLALGLGRLTPGRQRPAPGSDGRGGAPVRRPGNGRG
ncbi:MULTISPECIES: hypothetical protein [unclassified Streptomyces]|uniref:hypothetical protein n=1 Tax=unclassified Streptomyces TaxID=2593676 RepID=UPI0018F8B6CD|nr:MULTISPECIES: hypothetical protein [unclassified Streptomyces]